MNKSQQNTVALLSTSVATATALYIAWRSYKSKIKREGTNVLQDMTELVDQISMEDLNILANSNSSSLKRSAEQVLLDRASKKWYLNFLYEKCMEDDLMEVRKAISVLGILCKHPNLKIRIAVTHGIDYISKALWKLTGSNYVKFSHQFETCQHTEKIFTCGIVALFDLVYDNDKRVEHFFACSRDFTSFILFEMIKDDSRHVSSTAKRWALFIIYQLFQCSTIKQELLGIGIISHVAKCFLITLGDTWQSNICLQMLVIYANKNPFSEVDFLNEMAQCGILPSVIGCMQSDDPEVIYWATGLVHEFCAKDLFKQAISKMPRIVRTLFDVLSRSEACDQKIVLRIFIFLSRDNEGFFKRLMTFNPLIKQLPVYLLSGNAGVVHWTLVLIHDAVASDQQAATELLDQESRILHSLLRLDFSDDSNKEQLLAETIGILCSCEMHLDLIVSSGAIKKILSYAKSENQEIQFWASEMLLNLAMASDSVKYHIIYGGGIKILLDFALAEIQSPPISKQAAKTLVMLGLTDTKLSMTLRSGKDSNIIVNQKEQSACSKGINFTILNLTSFTFSRCKVYDLTSNNCNIGELIHNLISSNKSDNVIFLTCQGFMNKYIPDDLKAVLSGVGFREYDYPENGTWALMSMKNYSMFQFQVDEDSVVEQRLCLSSLVNLVIKHSLLIPVVDILTCIPASRNISRVSELDLIGILGRHKYHVRVMASVPGFLDYLTELIWIFTCIEPGELVDFSIGRFVSTHPLPLAHCIGALKIFHAISMCQQTRMSLANSNVIACLVSALLSVTAIYLTAMCRKRKPMESETIEVSGASPKLKQRSATCSQMYEKSVSTSSIHQRPSSSITSTDGEDFTDNDEASELEDDLFNLPSSVPPFSSNLDSMPSRRTIQRPISRSFSESSQRAKSPQKDIASHFEDISDVLSNIISYTIMTIYHVICDENEIDDELEAVIRESGLLQLAWCLLLTRNKSWKIGITVSKLLAQFSIDEQQGCFDYSNDVYLKKMSPGAILSVDLLRVANGAWTFESVQASISVSAEDYPNVLGWYYEIKIGTDGIMQIGWSNDSCKYCNTKGIGIGDNSNSIGFDGAREKVWNGPPGKANSEKDYGKTWSSGDVVSCLLTINGECSFWLNGVDLGVAISNLDMSRKWFPAVSLSLDQQCDCNFGKTKLTYQPPTGFLSIHDAYQQKISQTEQQVTRSASRDRASSFLGSASSSSSTSCDVIAPLPRTVRSNSVPVRRDTISIRRSRHSVVTPSEYYLHFQDEDSTNYPILYYEIKIERNGYPDLKIGFQSICSGNLVTCHLSQMNVELPTSDNKKTITMKVKNVLGCGLNLNNSEMFFTVDGVVASQNIPFENDGKASSIVNAFPYFSDNILNVNFGEFDFQYHKRNSRQGKLRSARGLYEGVLKMETPEE